MLCQNWALIERNDDGTATAYFFQDQGGKERPAIIDSLSFAGVPFREVYAMTRLRLDAENRTPHTKV